MTVAERRAFAIQKIIDVMDKGAGPLFQGSVARVRRDLQRVPLKTLGDILEYLAIPLANERRRTACADSSVRG